MISWQVALFLPLSLIATYALWPPALDQIPVSAWAGLAYVSFISQFFAFFVFNAAMAMGGVARIGQLMLLQPFVIVALSVPVNGEHSTCNAAVCRGGRNSRDRWPAHGC